MSAGNFELAVYQPSYDTTARHPIRVQPETLLLTITTPGGAEDNVSQGTVTSNPISARVSGGRRELGLNARKVIVQFTGTPPTGYQAGGRISLPWLSATTFSQLAKAQVGSYLNAPVVVVGLTPEAVN